MKIVTLDKRYSRIRIRISTKKMLVNESKRTKQFVLFLGLK